MSRHVQICSAMGNATVGIKSEKSVKKLDGLVKKLDI
jgi:hypothetical protein